VYTRCPACHTVHPVNAALLAVGGGRYRCGKCSKVSNALESLFDDWPRPSAAAPQPGDIPVLGLSLDIEAAEHSRQAGPDPESGGSGNAGEATGSRGPGRRLRMVWVLGAIVIAAVAAWQWAEFQGKPLLERPQVQAALIQLGLREPPPDKPYRNLDRIHVVSRQLTSHPYLPGQLRLTATIVNRAKRTQPYPEIEVALLDAASQVVMKKRIAPKDYLDPASAPGAGMVPQAYLPLVVDLPDPGRQAVGFEIAFR